MTKLINELKELIEKDERLTLKETCVYLDISCSTLYKLTSKNKIPHFKPNGKKIYFRKSDLNEWLFRNRVSSQ